MEFNAVISTDKTVVTLIPGKALKLNTIYFISVKNGLYDFAGNNLELFQTSISTMLTNNRIEMESTNDIFVFPNPVQSILNVKVQNEDECRINLYGSNGNLFLSEKIENGQTNCKLNLAGLIQGIYYLNVTRDNTSVTKIIVKY